MLFTAFHVAGLTRYGNFTQAWTLYQWPMLAIAIIYVISFYAFTLYETGDRSKSAFFLSRLCAAVGFGFLISSALSYFVFPLRIARWLAILCAGYTLVFVGGWRTLFDQLCRTRIQRKRVLIMGAGKLGAYVCKIARYVESLDIIGFLDDDQDKHHGFVHGVEVLGPTERLPEMAKQDSIDIVVVAIKSVKEKDLLDRLLAAKMSRVKILDASTFYELTTGRIPMAHVRLGWIVFTSINGMARHLYTRFKRYCDIALALFGLVLASPVMLITAILIKLDSKGPLIYKQQRMGQHGKEFMMFKFRSMVVDAEKKQGGLYTSVKDARVTRVGRIIRRVRIDELPQLWNVLIGDMSFVGPRPEAMELSHKYEQHISFYALCHAIKPGLTGWAQVKFPYSASVEDAEYKFEFDMFYIKNMSILLDVQIVLQTINVLFFLISRNESVKKDTIIEAEDAVATAKKLLEEGTSPGVSHTEASAGHRPGTHIVTRTE